MIDVAVAAAAAAAAACLRAWTVALWLNIVWDEVVAVGARWTIKFCTFTPYDNAWPARICIGVAVCLGQCSRQFGLFNVTELWRYWGH